MTAIKICGLKHQQDILWANKLQIAYAGFVFAESSRKVSPDWVKEAAANLSPAIKKVGVFVNHPLNELKEIASYCHLDIVQLHGEESPDYCLKAGPVVWKALRIKDKDSLKAMTKYHVDGFVVDRYHPVSYGGTGMAFDWDLLHSVSMQHKIILAGGLNEENVQKAIIKVRPFAVDVSSGVEEDGSKDFNKMLHFVEKVREYDETGG